MLALEVFLLLFRAFALRHAMMVQRTEAAMTRPQPSHMERLYQEPHLATIFPEPVTLRFFDEDTSLLTKKCDRPAVATMAMVEICRRSDVRL